MHDLERRDSICIDSVREVPKKEEVRAAKLLLMSLNAEGSHMLRFSVFVNIMESKFRLSLVGRDPHSTASSKHFASAQEELLGVWSGIIADLINVSGKMIVNYTKNLYYTSMVSLGNRDSHEKAFPTLFHSRESKQIYGTILVYTP